MNLATKGFFQKAVFSRQIFSENQKFFLQPEGHMNNKVLRVVRKHTIEAIFQVMRVGVNYRKAQKLLKLIALHLNSTLTRPPIYKEAYTEKHETASPGNSVGVTELSLILSFVQLDKKVFGRIEKS